mmetsp:Transcript_82776/g.198659  ORF Transcript_82776/g.198659 Transcript_82776/m.198659 type:complete len:293 (-) Transcript_82776:1685-2563(-)
MLQHGHGQREPHPPAGGQLRDRVVQLGIVEAHLQQGLPPSIIDADILGHLDAVLQRVQVALAHLPQLGVIHVHALQVHWHAHDAVGRDLLHQRGLPRAVVAHHAVAAVLAHLQGGVLEEEMPCTVHEQQVLHSEQHLVVRVAALRVGVKSIPNHRAHHVFTHRRQLVQGWRFTHLLLECQGCGKVFGHGGHLFPAMEVLVLLAFHHYGRRDGRQMVPHTGHELGEVGVAIHDLSRLAGGHSRINALLARLLLRLLHHLTHDHERRQAARGRALRGWWEREWRGLRHIALRSF